MKKTISLITLIIASYMVLFANPPMLHHRPGSRMISPSPHVRYHNPRHHHHHHVTPFFTGVGVGFAAGLIAPLPVPAPVAIAPVVGRVWVPPVYEMRPVYDQLGNVLRYEQVMVSAGFWRY